MHLGLLFLLIVILIFLVSVLSAVRDNAGVNKANAGKLILKGKISRAQAMLRVLADKGDAEAEYLHGMTALHVADNETFIASMIKAAEGGYSPAAIALARNFIASDGAAHNLAATQELLLPLVDAGDKEALTLLLLLKARAMCGNREALEELLYRTPAEDNGAENDPLNVLEELRARKAAAGEVWKAVMQYQIPGLDERPDAVREKHKRALEKAIDEIHKTIVEGCSRDGKVDFRMALNAAGALAGFGCQMGIRDGVVASGKVALEDAFVVLAIGSKEKYYFGDTLNLALFEFPLSVYGHIKGGVMMGGGYEMPDIKEMAKRIVSAIGSDEYDRLSVAESERPSESPSGALRRFWPLLYPEIRKDYAQDGRGGIDPNELGWLFAFATQRLIREAKGEVDAEIAGAIAMEAAMRTAKLDPERIGVC